MPESYQEQLTEVQHRIEELSGEILLRQMQIHRYEQMGHKLVELMMEDHGTDR